MGTLRFIFSLMVIVCALFLASGVYTYYPGHENWDNEDAGIFTGFIHGAIAPIMVLGSLISEYRIYEPNNNGWFYDFSFVLGILIAWAGTTKGGTRIVNKYYNRESRENSTLQSIEKKIDEKIFGMKNKKSNNSDEKNKK